jgi:hypothetical protein
MIGKMLPPFRLCGARLVPALVAALLFLPLRAMGQLDSKGYPVTNPNWQMLVTDAGYADLALDKRPGFEGREYLSGEWAAAIQYTVDGNQVGPIWLQKQWYYPDWESNSNFNTVEAPVHPANPPKNASGLDVFQSTINNGVVRVLITYEMVNSNTGIAQGTTRKSTPGAGSSILSDQYVFKQTYQITNISNKNLTNIRLFQFLHGLESTKCLYDDRLYPGAMSEYRYDITQQGDSFGTDIRDGSLVTHHDTITLHSKVQPSAWEAGYYGKMGGVDDHVEGKPSVGVHLSVEANNLNNVDYFEPPEGQWVGGAQRYELGNLASNASVTFDVLFTIHTTTEVTSGGANVKVRSLQKIPNNKLRLEFEETTGGPFAFILFKSTNVTTPAVQWLPQSLPYNFSAQTPGIFWFEIPIAANEPRAFFRVQAVPNGGG